MKVIFESSSSSPDDLIIKIKNDKQLLYKNMENILKSPKRRLQVRHRLRSDVNFNIENRTQNANKEYNNFEKYVKKFNELYIEYGEVISKYYNHEMGSLYNYSELVLSSFNQISILGVDISIENYSKLDLLQKAIEFIVNEFIELEKKSNYNLRFESQREEELKRIEYESEINKDYHSNIRKMVNHICSQITSDNPAHTQDRLKDFLRLFEGENIHLVGTENHTFNLRSHPRAKEICWKFLQKAVITQAESQFCANIDTVLVFASLLAAILGKFPNEMNAMLTALEMRFSQLLNTFQSPTDEYDEQEHLNSLLGIGRLVAAISVARPPPGFPAHPDLNSAFLWSLLARMCNRTSASIFTAQAFLGLLEIGSGGLLACYGNQFEKLLVAIQEKFEVPKSLTERSLALFISEGLANKSFSNLGCLPDDYWLR